MYDQNALEACARKLCDLRDINPDEYENLNDAKREVQNTLEVMLALNIQIGTVPKRNT